MTRLLLTGDTHASNKLVQRRSRLPISLQLFKDIDDLAVQYDAIPIIAGDVVDSKLTMPAEVYLGLYDHFQQAKKRAVLLKGNHCSPKPDDPSCTLLRLFAGLCDVVADTFQWIDYADLEVALLPWNPPQMYRQQIQRMMAIAPPRTKPRILISHVGLHGAILGSSNFEMPGEIRVEDMPTGGFDMIGLGDIHAHQWIKPNIVYFGSPIPHAHGDDNVSRVWLFDSEDMSLKALSLPGDYPMFETWEIESEAELKELELDSFDYHRIRVPRRLYKLAEAKWGKAYPILLQDDEHETLAVDTEESRASLQERHDYAALVERWVAYKALKDPAEAKALETTGKFLIEAFQKGGSVA